MAVVLRPINQYALKNGVKSIAYGEPGCGKTPLMQTAPNPVVLVCEPGMLSMRNSTLPAAEGFTAKSINEFQDWLFKSSEARKFDTVCIDSVSQMAEIYLKDEMSKTNNKLRAYGEMSQRVMSFLDGLFFMPQKHTYLIAKQEIFDDNGAVKKRPYFPGKDLNVKVPHLYDLVLHIGRYQVPGIVGTTLAIRAHGTFDTSARDRSGFLSELNEPNLNKLFKTAMGN